MSGHARTPSDPEPQPGAGGRWPDFAPPGSGASEPTQLLSGPAGQRPEPTALMPTPGRTVVQPVAASAGDGARPRKPRSRTAIIAVISVLAILAVLIAGDRVANAVAQNVLAAQLQTELNTPTRPDVRIGGFPFVTQVLGGSFSSVDVTASDATVQDGGAAVSIARLDATVTDITASDRFQTIVAGRGEATALVDWDSVSALAGQQVSHVADDRMRIDFSVPIGRLSIEGYITGRPQLNSEEQTVIVADPKVTVASVDVPQAVVDAVSRVVLQPYPIEDLPYDIQVTGLVVQPDGLALSGTGREIPLRGR